jgi:phosphoglycolate phosphatase-like HAD superfamily hydrolase
MDLTQHSCASPGLPIPQGKLLRPWDAFHAYLFDVDGTLLNCRDAVHYFAFCNALRELSGRELTLEGVTAHGNTDVGILRDALTLAGIPQSTWRPHLDSACNSMCSYVEAHRAEVSTTALAGTADVLRHLRSRGALVGVATGNIEGIGRIKLQSAGLADCFDFLAFSDGLENRRDVYSRALELARSLAGERADICAIGDTPADIHAARDHRISIIAVATGVHSLEQLSAEQPDLCLFSLSELVP